MTEACKIDVRNRRVYDPLTNFDLFRNNGGVMRFAFAIVMFALWAGPVGSGPWPREQGKTFLSFQSILRVDPKDVGAGFGTLSTFYGERGLARGYTLGFQGVIDEVRNADGILFLRVPVTTKSKDLKLAYQLGAGFDGREGALAQLGVSVGRGLKTRWGHGWATIDTQVQYRIEHGEAAFKADFAFGVSHGERDKYIFQIQSGRYPGEHPHARFAPSYVRKVNDIQRIEIGAEFGLVNEQFVGLRFGSWLEF